MTLSLEAGSSLRRQGYRSGSLHSVGLDIMVIPSGGNAPISLHCDPLETVAALKERLQQKSDIFLPKFYDLSYWGEKLEDGNVLSDYCILSGSQLYMIPRPGSNLQVQASEIKDPMLSCKYATFKIKSIHEFDRQVRSSRVSRRFSNFEKLYEELCLEQGASKVPSLPKVSFADRLESDELHRREVLLTQFLSECKAKFPNSRAMKIFLTSQDAYQVESTCTLL